MSKKISNQARREQYQEKYKRVFSIYWFKYCSEPLENIQGWNEMLNDTSGQQWVLHHRDEIPEGGGVVSRNELKSRGEYYNLPANKLLFLTKSEHQSLHQRGENHSNWGKHLSEETKKKVSENSWMRGRTGELHPNSKPIEVEGVPYVSLKAAVKALKIGNRKIYNWLREGKAKYL